MTEKEWAKQVQAALQKMVDGFQRDTDTRIEVREGFRLAYACEVTHYEGSEARASTTAFQTDLLVAEIEDGMGSWKPRVVIELKLGEPTTHAAITYSQKAATHKAVHPYLRYGVLIGSVKALSGRFFRHGENFDFMASWQSEVPDNGEQKVFAAMLAEEIEASRAMERLLFNTRSQDRQRYSLLHRKLELM